jgi:leader peptidase (prepilin peptidase) / N-methyltransferase
MQVFVIAVGLGLVGALAGGLGRWLLGRLPRGASVRPGWCEAALCLLWAVVGLRLAAGELPAWWAPIPLALSWLAVLLTVTDLRHRRLPDALTLPAYPAAALLIVVATPWAGWPLALGATLGLTAYLAIHGVVHALRPRSLGAGDVKLSGSLGAVLGAVGWPTLILAAWLAALCTLGLRLAAPTRFRHGIPHAPGLLAATTLIALFPAL